MLKTLHPTPDTIRDSYDAAIDEAIAASNDDTRSALRALLIANELLEIELARLHRLQHATRKQQREAEAA